MPENKCRYCGADLDSTLKMTTNRFPYYNCPECKRKNLFPLSKRDRIGIQILLILFGFISLVMLFVSGDLYLPGIFTLYLIWDLHKNKKIEKELREYKEGKS